MLSSGKGQDTILTACARQIWYLAAANSTTIEILHKDGKKLVLADSLSRSGQSSAAAAKAQAMCTELDIHKIDIAFESFFHHMTSLHRVLYRAHYLFGLRRYRIHR